MMKENNIIDPIKRLKGVYIQWDKEKLKQNSGGNQSLFNGWIEKELVEMTSVGHILGYQ